MLLWAWSFLNLIAATGNISAISSLLQPALSASWLKSLPRTIYPLHDQSQCLLTWGQIHPLDDWNQCLLWWDQIYALPDCAQCVPSWKNLSTTRQEPVPPLMGQAPFSSWLRSVPPLLGLNPSLYKISISLKVKIVFIVVDSGFLAVPCPFVSGSLVSSIFPLISSCD